MSGWTTARVTPDWSTTGLRTWLERLEAPARSGVVSPHESTFENIMWRLGPRDRYDFLRSKIWFDIFSCPEKCADFFPHSRTVGFFTAKRVVQTLNTVAIFNVRDVWTVSIICINHIIDHFFNLLSYSFFARAQGP